MCTAMTVATISLGANLTGIVHKCMQNARRKRQRTSKTEIGFSAPSRTPSGIWVHWRCLRKRKVVVEFRLVAILSSGCLLQYIPVATDTSLILLLQLIFLLPLLFLPLLLQFKKCPNAPIIVMLYFFGEDNPWGVTGYTHFSNLFVAGMGEG